MSTRGLLAHWSLLKDAPGKLDQLPKYVASRTVHGRRSGNATLEAMQPTLS